MKKILVITTIVLLLCMTACTNNEKSIEKQLQGTWYFTVNEMVSRYTFENGKYTPSIKYDGEIIPGETGTYEIDIENSKILVYFDDQRDGEPIEFPYDYQKGDLFLQFGEWTLTKEK